MAAGRLLMGSKAVIARRGQRRRRNQPAENAGSARDASAAVPPGSPAPPEEGHGSAERARLLRKASAHARMAAQISDLMQGNVAESEDLRRLAGSLRPADQLADGSRGGRLPARLLCGTRSRCSTGLSPGRSRRSAGIRTKAASASRQPAYEDAEPWATRLIRTGGDPDRARLQVVTSAGHGPSPARASGGSAAPRRRQSPGRVASSTSSTVRMPMT